MNSAARQYRRWKAALATAAWACAAAFGGSNASAQPGSASHPIPVHMRRGSDVVRLTGVLSQNRDCCAFVFKAHAGQTLHWTLTGPTVRIVLTYPDGHSDGPGVPPDAPLPADGAYVFSMSGDTMAEDAFGRFVLTLRIPPR